MNRMEEYEALRTELERPAAIHAVENARKRLHRRRMNALRGLSAATAALMLFVVLVNVSVPVAEACARVPLLRELAKAVTLNQSLKKAVDNDYAQKVGLSETKDGVTVSVDYLIVDQKQLSVFYRIDGPKGERYDLEWDPCRPDGSSLPMGDSGDGSFVTSGEVRTVSMDFAQETMPDEVLLKLNLYRNDNQPVEIAVGEPLPEDIPQPTAIHMEFPLKFDPEFTAQGRIIQVNQTAELDGQRIIMESAEIYPTHMRLNVATDGGNTALLRNLKFCMELEDGTRIDSRRDGITAFHPDDSHVTFFAESPYFYNAQKLTLLFEGADWLDERWSAGVRVDTEAQTCGALPEGLTFKSAQIEENGQMGINFLLDKTSPLAMGQIFSWEYETDGGEQYIIGMGQWINTADGKDEQIIRMLLDENVKQVTLKFWMNRCWQAETPVRMEIPLND